MSTQVIEYILIFFFQYDALRQQIDPLLTDKIHKYVKEGVSNVREMARLLDMFVKDDIFEGSPLPDNIDLNRRYYPTRKHIQQHMLECLRRNRKSRIDQVCLKAKIEEWKRADPERRIFFREKNAQAAEPSEPVITDQEIDPDELHDKADNPPGSLLFVYQSKNHRELLSKYGEELSFLDATYRTTKYVLPLFLIVVKTNVGYQPVAAFVTENETKAAIKEALLKIKEWNPDFQPRFCMTDYCNEEIDAWEEVFPGMYFLHCFCQKSVKRLSILMNFWYFCDFLFYKV